MKTVIISKNDAGQRCDKFLNKAFPNIPSSLLNKYFRLKRIKLFGKRVLNNYILKENDELSLYINDELLENNSTFGFLQAPTNLNIVYEDENIMLINKKVGLLCHSDDHVDTLINRIKNYLSQKGEYDYKNEKSFAPALCNRIDRNTQGIVIAAKNAQSLRVLNEKIKKREITKKYLCVCLGYFDKKSDTIKGYLRKDCDKNKVYIYNKKVAESKEIITKYQVLKEKDDMSLVEVDLLTGRTHQIRAHMAYIGHSLLGDGKYGKLQNGVKTQALCSYKLVFSFKEDAQNLNYLKDKSFEIDEIWFKELFSE